MLPHRRTPPETDPSRIGKAVATSHAHAPVRGAAGRIYASRLTVSIKDYENSVNRPAKKSG